MMVKVMGVPLKTENEDAAAALACFGQWVRRAEGYRETTIEGDAWRYR
jgi:hypothetical protein